MSRLGTFLTEQEREDIDIWYVDSSWIAVYHGGCGGGILNMQPIHCPRDNRKRASGALKLIKAISSDSLVVESVKANQHLVPSW